MNFKDDLVRHYRWLRQYGLNDSHSGNASIRDGDNIWITPTGCCADTVTPDDLVQCDMNGVIGEKASLDAALHGAIYQANPTARAVLHSHGAYSVAMTLNGDAFVPVDFEGQLYFPWVPVITIPFDHYVQDSPQRVSQMLTQSPVTVVQGHGVYAWGETLNLAYKWTCSLELSAKIAFIAAQAAKK